MKGGQAELQKANKHILKLERGVTTTQQKSGPTDSNATSQTLREEVELQTAIATKAERVAQLVESEIDYLRAELHQSSD